MIKLLFCGDFVSQAPEMIEVDSELKSLFSEQDFVAVNFEAPIEGYGKPICKSGPSLVQSRESPSFIEGLGVNIVQLANNHMMDYGQKACEETISSFGDATLLGVGRFDEAYKLIIVEKSDIKIGFLSFTHKEFGVLGIDSQDGDYGTAWINHPQINQIILSAKEKCDIIIALPHAGVEDMIVPLPEWRCRYRELIDLGIDVVIASHPHTPQGWEEYHGKMIYYSLGNFFFQVPNTQQVGNWCKGLMVQMVIADDKTISFQVYNSKFSENYLGLDDSKAIKDYNDYLNDFLCDDVKYRRYLNEYLLSLWNVYKIYLLRGLSAITLRTNFHVFLHAGYGLMKGPDIPLLLNSFQCESHCWAIERMLKLYCVGKE